MKNGSETGKWKILMFTEVKQAMNVDELKDDYYGELRILLKLILINPKENITMNSF